MVQDHGEREEGALPKICSHVGGGEMILELLLDYLYLKDIIGKSNSGILTPWYLGEMIFLDFQPVLSEFLLMTGKKTSKVGTPRSCQCKMPFEDSCL